MIRRPVFASHNKEGSRGDEVLCFSVELATDVEGGIILDIQKDVRVGLNLCRYIQINRSPCTAMLPYGSRPPSADWRLNRPKAMPEASFGES